MSDKKIVWGILDRWHKYINGDNFPEVRSNMPAFETDKDFFEWCWQHGADKEWYDTDKFTPCMKCGVLIEYTAEFCCNQKECGCRGLPVHPPLCVDCWKEVMVPK